MSSQFKPEELVKVSGKSYPVVGGRLRLAHEDGKVSIETIVITYDGEKAIIQAKVTTDKGIFNGLGNATITRDAKLKNAILELAETRAIARALRFAGYGVEFTGFEEMPTGKQTEDDGEFDDAENQKPSKNLKEALILLAEHKGVDLKSKSEEITGKTASKDWNMKDYYNIKNAIDDIKDKVS
jgi:hypothetical protein